MKKIIIGMIAGILTLSCSVNPSKLSNSYADKFANNVTYGMDRKTGLCFGFIASRKTGDTDSTGIGMTYVPCAAVSKFIK